MTGHRKLKKNVNGLLESVENYVVLTLLKYSLHFKLNNLVQTILIFLSSSYQDQITINGSHFVLVLFVFTVD